MTQAGRDLPTPIYSATIVALVMHFAVQLCYPVGERQFEATTEVRLSHDSPPLQLAAEELQGWRRAQSIPRTETLLVSLRPTRTHASSSPSLRFTVRSRTQETSLEQANALAQRFVSWQQEAWSAKHRQERAAYNWELQEARHYERKARESLESFLRNHFEQYAHNAKAGKDRSRQAIDRSMVVGTSSGEQDDRTLNPKWQVLREQYLELQTQLTTLKASRTAAHPEVQHVQARLEQIKQALDTTPEFLSEPKSNSNRLTKQSGPVSRRVASDDSAIDLVARYDLLREEYRAAEAKRRGLEDSFPADSSRPLNPPIWEVRTATAARALPASPSRLRHVLAWLAGLLAGGGVAVVMLPCRRLKLIGGSADVTNLLGIGVLGELSEPREGADERERLERRGFWLTWMTRAGEWILIAIVLWALYQAWGTSEFAHAFRVDPWETLAESVQSRWGRSGS